MRWGWMIVALMLGVIAGCGSNARKEELKAAEEKARREAAAQNASKPEAVGGEKTADPTPPKPGEQPKDEKSPSGETAKLDLGERSLLVPATWKKEDLTGSMRKAQYRIPKTGDDATDGEMVVFMLGGGLEANLKRWAGQMGGDDSQKSRHTVKTASGDEATIAEYEGSYAGMNPASGAAMPAQAGYKMLAAYIISGGKEYQFKLTGPTATVNAAKPGFERMVESFK